MSPLLFQFEEGLKDITAAIQCFPVMNHADSYLPAWAMKLFFPSMVKTLKKGPVKLTQFYTKRIEEHRRTFDPEKPRDVMDQYINHRTGEKEFTDYRFACTMTILSFDGIETLGCLVQWALLLLAGNPGE